MKHEALNSLTQESLLLFFQTLLKPSSVHCQTHVK